MTIPLIIVVAWLYASGAVLAATLISGDVQQPRIIRCVAFITFWPIGVLLIVAAAIISPDHSAKAFRP